MDETLAPKTEELSAAPPAPALDAPAPETVSSEPADSGEEHGKKTWKEKIVYEISEIAIVVGYLAVSFCILQTFRCATLMVSCDQNDFMTSYATSAITAVVLGKFVFVLEKTKLAKRFESKPLIVPVLYKTFLFTVVMNLALHAEQRFLHKSSEASPMSSPHTFWPTLLAHELALFVTFFVFFAFRDIGRVMGQRRLRRMFFIDRDSWKE